MLRLHIHPENPQSRHIAEAARIVQGKDGICLYPTDTVYGVGCCVSNNKKLKEIAKILHRDEERLFSFICSDIAQAEEYVKIDNRAFKILKRYTPGPFTFILPSSNFVKKKISQKRKTVGIRIPDFPVTQELIREIGEPLANMTLNIPGEYRSDPDQFMTPDVLNGVDVMLDCGPVEMAGGSTIIDLTGPEPEIIRQGKGEWYE